MSTPTGDSQFRITNSLTRTFTIVPTEKIMVSSDIRALVKELNDGNVPQSLNTQLLTAPTGSGVSRVKYNSLIAHGWLECDLVPLRVATSTLDPDRLTILDGRHRFIAYIVNGYTEVPVLIT